MAPRDTREVVRVKGIIYSTRSNKDGEWFITISIPPSDATKAAALSVQKETLFDVDFRIDPESAGQQPERL